MEKRYPDIGGTIRGRARVWRIIVEAGAAGGVVLADGAEVRADIVASAADVRATLFDMLGEEYLDKGVLATRRPGRVSDQPVRVNLGVALDVSRWSHTVSFLLPRPVEVGGRTHTRTTVGTHGFDPSMAPAGAVARDPELYHGEKQNAADTVIRIMEARCPGFTSQVEVVDVSTPPGRERQTANYLGAMQGWRSDPDKLRALLSSRARHEPGLVRDFSMAGQWAEAWGGITTVAQSWRKLVQRVVCREGRRFAASIP
jgi:phytoene dehydrogenase-like protein